MLRRFSGGGGGVRFSRVGMGLFIVEIAQRKMFSNLLVSP